MLTALGSIPATSVTHIPAIYEHESLQVANFTALESRHGISVLNHSFSPRDNCTRVDCSLPVLGCAVSHLRALHAAYAANVPHALILEDDIDFESVLAWKMSLGQYVRKLSDKPWDVVQLLLHASNSVWDRLQQKWHSLQKPHYLQPPAGLGLLGTGAYLVSREGISKLVKAFPLSNGVLQVSEVCKVHKDGSGDNLIELDFTADNCLLSGEAIRQGHHLDSPVSFVKYLAAPPLFTDREDLRDGIHSESRLHVDSRTKWRKWRRWFEEAEARVP